MSSDGSVATRPCGVRMIKASCIALATAGLLSSSGCEQVEQVQDQFRDMTPYEAYYGGLSEAGLANTALARDWLEAGTRAMAAATPIGLPFEEEGFITPDDPGAVAYRITIGRGQKLSAQVSSVPQSASEPHPSRLSIARHSACQHT